MRKKILLPFLGFGHGLNDCIAGYFLGCLVQLHADTFQIGFGLFIYNLLAFGGQYFVALLMEKQNSPKKFLLLSYSLNISAILFFSFLPDLSIVVAGIASAIYHVAGGTASAQQDKASHIGIFAAPGVAGLILGGYFSYLKFDLQWWLLVISILFFTGLLFILLPKPAFSVPKEKQKNIGFDQHDLVMIFLLTIISLRSVIWNVFQLIHENDYEWLLAIAIAAFAGKIIGGWLADKIGWRLYTFISLAAAAPLVTFFRKEIVLFCIGIGLLQSGIPATTMMLIKSMKGKKERAIGLSFGATIMAGAIVFYTPAKNFFLSDSVLLMISVAMLIILLFYKKNHFQFRL